VGEIDMQPIRRILVAIKDPSARSLPAVDKAVQLARAFGAKVELFHAIATHVYTDFDLVDQKLEELKRERLTRCQKRLEVIAERVRQQGVAIHTLVEWDYPAHEAVIRAAERVGADLIIAECHAGRRIAPLLLHLTDWELLRCSPVPVLLVKSKRLYRNPLVLAAVDPTHANSKPLQLDDEIVRAARRFRSALRGSLHAVHAFVPLPVDAKPSELLNEHFAEQLEARARIEARARLDKTLRHVQMKRGNRHLINQHPVNGIPDLARKLHADIVVMGAVSRSGLKRFFIGNTAERVVDDLACDVLVVKPREFVTRVKSPSRGARLVSSPMPLPY
jgi:universal stress protein E